jgi:hypothetical protein
MILGAGRDAVGELGIERIDEALRLANRTVHLAGDDLLIAGDVLVPTRTRADDELRTG